MSGLVTPVCKTTKLYRVSVKETLSLQPDGSTFWNWTVLYCGYDLNEARRVVWQSKPADVHHGFGNRARKTVLQKKTFHD